MTPVDSGDACLFPGGGFTTPPLLTVFPGAASLWRGNLGAIATLQVGSLNDLKQDGDGESGIPF